MVLDAAPRKFTIFEVRAISQELSVRTIVRDTLSDWESVRPPRLTIFANLCYFLGLGGCHGYNEHLTARSDEAMGRSAS